MKKCREILLKIGMKESLKGFGYICEAINIMREDSRVSDIYYNIAKSHNTSSCNVEKAIRNAFESARCNLDKYELIDEYLGYDNCSNYNTLVHLYNKVKEETKNNKDIEEIRSYIQTKCQTMIDEILAELLI